MPNWCNTSYVFDGNKEEIADLYKKLRSLKRRRNSLVENGFGKLWLGCVVALFGGDWHKIECRGEIDCMEQLTDTTINLSTTTAWGDMPEVWDFVCQQYPSVKYYFMAEESGNCYYATNDVDGKFFSERFQIEQYDESTEFYATMEEVFADISERINVKITTIEELDTVLEAFNEANEDDWIYVNEYDIITPNAPST